MHCCLMRCGECTTLFGTSQRFTTSGPCFPDMIPGCWVTVAGLFVQAAAVQALSASGVQNSSPDEDCGPLASLAAIVSTRVLDLIRGMCRHSASQSTVA